MVLLGVFAAQTTLAATISGKVTDLATANPLPSMIVAAYTEGGTLQSTATTDSTGRYELTVPPGTYRLLAYDNAGTYATTFSGDAESYETSPTTVVTGDIANVNFALRRGGTISGTVAPPPGSADSITVAAYNLDGTRRGFATADASGAYTLVLPPGNYKLVAYDDAGNFWPSFFFNQTNFASATILSVVAGQNATATFRLGLAGHLKGRLLDASTHAPLGGFTVFAYDDTGAEISTATSGVDGSFDLKVPAGSYRIAAADPRGTYATAFFGGSSFTIATPLSISAGQTRTDLDVALQRGGTIHGRVTNPSGSPLSAIVAAYAIDGVLQLTTATDGSGNYTLLLPPGEYRIAAFDPDLVYATQFYAGERLFEMADRVSVTAGVSAGPVDFVLEHGGRITGTVVDDQTNVAIGGITVAAYDDASGEAVSTTSTSAAGAYTLVVPPGTYRIVAFDESLGYAAAFAGGSSYETATAFVETRDSVERIDFRLRPGIRVSGTVTDADGAPVSGVEISALDSGGNHIGTTTATNGSFALSLLPNTYRFIAVDPQGRFATAETSSPVMVAKGMPPPSITLVLQPRARRRAVQH